MGSLETWKSSAWEVTWGYPTNLCVRTLGLTGASFIFAVLQPGLINQANGSAYIETERTKIACAVFVLSCRRTLGHSIDFSAQDMVPDNPRILHTVKEAD